MCNISYRSSSLFPSAVDKWLINCRKCEKELLCRGFSPVFTSCYSAIAIPYLFTSYNTFPWLWCGIKHSSPDSVILLPLPPWFKRYHSQALTSPRSLGQTSSYLLKGLAMRNRHVKNQSAIPFGSKDITKVTFYPFQDVVNASDNFTKTLFV